MGTLSLTHYFSGFSSCKVARSPLKRKKKNKKGEKKKKMKIQRLSCLKPTWKFVPVTPDLSDGSCTLSACLSEIANLWEEISLGGAQLEQCSPSDLRLQVFAGGRWKSKWITSALLNNHSAPLWFHTPVVISASF